ncbi:MAG TPA: glycoside hydrolase family 1 protein [Patescibacteria group bacterium]|nr:glycoside hydrolase family 1 protein [Patescibacteria group bacterium]
MAKNKKKAYDSHHEPRVFPKGFLWGTATSSYQVEGGNKNSDWWKWEKEEGKISDGTRSGNGVDHYNRYKEDFDIAQDRLHNNSHRLSLEWSRLEPNEGEWDEREFDHYRAVLMDLKKRNMTVMLTIHHFTNPQWLFEKGGWEKRYVIKRYLRFVEKVTAELGEYVDLWCTINEPMVYMLQGYVFVEWPPQKKSKIAAARVLWHMARAHRGAYKVIHRWAKRNDRKAMVGIANNVSSYAVYRKHSFFDNIMTSIMDRATNHLFYMLSGSRTHDYLGLNYYFHFRIKSAYSFLKSAFGKPVDEMAEATFESSDIGWELFPHGIFDICVDLASYKKPIYITENGLATSNDDKRIRVIVGYLLQVFYAIESGADVRGYFHWSLLDNFEWAKGFEPTFGLVEVDRDTMKRTPRPSSEVYGLIAKGNKIEHDFLQFLGHGTTGILEEWKSKNAK